jgi:hypothetical protein
MAGLRTRVSIGSSDALQGGGSGIANAGLSGGGSGSGTNVGTKTAGKAHSSKMNNSQGSGFMLEHFHNLVVKN